MFKSIQYKLYFYTALLIIVVVLLTCSIFFKYYIYTVILAIAFLIILILLFKSYSKYNQNILFLLEAIDNGDYSFHFSETKRSRRERELNAMLNRIKEILVNARKEVIENEKFLSVIIESVSTGIIIVNDRGIVHTVNQAVLNMLGMPVFTHLNQLGNINETFPELFQKLKAGDNTQITVINEREELQISMNVSEIKLGDRIMRIITLNNIGNELENKELESWIRLIRVLTHEIMNSIAPITSLSATLLSQLHSAKPAESPDNLKRNTIEAFETINTTATGLLSFVESYRKFSAIPKPEIHEFSLNQSLDKVIKLYEKAIRDKNISVELIMPSDLPVTLRADEKLINQVLMNLLKNAIEATDNSMNEKITISVNKKTDKKTTISISNTGSLIPDTILPHIFIPFFTTKEAGSGIGLSVSRYIMQLHGGKLQHFVSELNETVFQLTLNNQ